MKCEKTEKSVYMCVATNLDYHPPPRPVVGSGIVQYRAAFGGQQGALFLDC